MTKYIAHQTLDREDALARGRELVRNIRGILAKTVVKWDESQHPRDEAGKFTEGVGHEASATEAAQPDAGTGGSGGSAVPKTAAKAKGGGRPEAVPEVQAVADSYNAKHGLPPVKHDYAKLDEVRAGTIADAYDALPLDDSDNPEVQAAYEALAKEIRAQYDHIVASGVTFTPWDKEGQPYQNSTEMVDDIKQNKHMFFYTGGEPNRFMAARDPETGLTVNDMFRAVHDYFGHAAGGYGFGPRGEENAWMSHSQMLSPLARRALTTETRGQNSWVNFGRHNYDAEGNHKNIPPQDRPFATQKTALMPEHYALLPGERALKFDESKVRRNTEKGHEGEFATKKGMTYAPNPEFIGRVKEQVEAMLVSQYQDHEYRKTKGKGPVVPWEDIPLEAIKERVTKTAREVLARAVPVVRVPDYVATKILDDGRFKSQHESKHSKGVLDPAYRTEAEQNMFGTSPQGDLKDRPIYGMMIEDFAEAQEGMLSQARVYGDAIFVLKDHMLDRATVSFGDSLVVANSQEMVAPRPYREFDWVGVGGTGWQLTNDSTVDKLFNYVEAQFHGGVTLDDVKEVMVPLSLYEWWSKPESGTLKKFQERGIAVRVIAPNHHKAR